MIEKRFVVAFVLALAGCSSPTVTLSHASNDGGLLMPAIGPNIVDTHTLAVGMADVLVVTPSSNDLVSVRSDSPSTLEVAATSSTFEFVFLAHALGHANVTILVGKDVAMTFDVSVIAQP